MLAGHKSLLLHLEIHLLSTGEVYNWVTGLKEVNMFFQDSDKYGSRATQFLSKKF
jgi:hypothetical protein